MVGGSLESDLQHESGNIIRMSVREVFTEIWHNVLGRRSRGKCRMGNCGWKFTFLGLKDADLRGESNAANCLCMQCLFAEIFTKRPKHQI